VKWLTNREWLDYDESNDIMTCKIWQRWWWWWLLWRLAWWSWKLLAYMNIQENKILHLNCVNFFWSSKKWFGPVKVLPLLDQMSSEIQGTFGMTGFMNCIYWEKTKNNLLATNIWIYFKIISCHGHQGSWFKSYWDIHIYGKSYI
jgi:hypothetical protein